MQFYNKEQTYDAKKPRNSTAVRLKVERKACRKDHQLFQQRTNDTGTGTVSLSPHGAGRRHTTGLWGSGINPHGKVGWLLGEGGEDSDHHIQWGPQTLEDKSEGASLYFDHHYYVWIGIHTITCASIVSGIFFVIFFPFNVDLETFNHTKKTTHDTRHDTR